MSNFYANLVQQTDGKPVRRNYKYSLPIAINDSDDSIDAIKNLKRSNKNNHKISDSNSIKNLNRNINTGNEQVINESKD